MVHVYNCHPYASQQIVQVSGAPLRQAGQPKHQLSSSRARDIRCPCHQVEQEPGLFCCGGGALFVVTTGGCKVIIAIMVFE